MCRDGEERGLESGEADGRGLSRVPWKEHMLEMALGCMWNSSSTILSFGALDVGSLSPWLSHLLSDPARVFYMSHPMQKLRPCFSLCPYCPRAWGLGKWSRCSFLVPGSTVRTVSVQSEAARVRRDKWKMWKVDWKYLEISWGRDHARWNSWLYLHLQAWGVEGCWSPICWMLSFYDYHCSQSKRLGESSNLLHLEDLHFHHCRLGVRKLGTWAHGCQLQSLVYLSALV